MMPEIRQISSDDAKSFLESAGFVDPSGWHSVATICNAGFCVEYSTEKGKAVCVVKTAGTALWVTGYAGQGDNFTQTGLPLVTRYAIDTGHKKLRFQTGRKGIAKLALKRGFEIVGYILEKAL